MRISADQPFAVRVVAASHTASQFAFSDLALVRRRARRSARRRRSRRTRSPIARRRYVSSTILMWSSLSSVASRCRAKLTMRARVRIVRADADDDGVAGRQHADDRARAPTLAPSWARPGPVRSSPRAPTPALQSPVDSKRVTAGTARMRGVAAADCASAARGPVTTAAARSAATVASSANAGHAGFVTHIVCARASIACRPGTSWMRSRAVDAPRRAPAHRRGDGFGSRMRSTGCPSTFSSGR